MNKEIRGLREEKELLKQKNAKLNIQVDNQGAYNRRLKTQVNNLSMEKKQPRIRNSTWFSRDLWRWQPIIPKNW